MVVNKQRSCITLVYLDTVSGLESGLARLTVLNRNNPILTNSFIYLGNYLTHRCVIIT